MTTSFPAHSSRLPRLATFAYTGLRRRTAAVMAMATAMTATAAIVYQRMEVPPSPLEAEAAGPGLSLAGLVVRRRVSAGARGR